MPEDMILEDAAIEAILDEAAEDYEDAEADLCDIGQDDIVDMMTADDIELGI